MLTFLEVLQEFSDALTDEFEAFEASGGVDVNKKGRYGSSLVASPAAFAGNLSEFLMEHPDLEPDINTAFPYDINCYESMDRSGGLEVRIRPDEQHPLMPYLNNLFGMSPSVILIGQVKKKKVRRNKQANPATGTTSFNYRSIMNHHIELNEENAHMDIVKLKYPQMLAKLNERWYQEQERIVQGIALLDHLQENNSPMENKEFSTAILRLTQDFLGSKFGRPEQVLDADWRYQFLKTWRETCPYGCDFWHP